MTKQDRVRILRVLEYEGPREWVEAAIKGRSVKGFKSFNWLYDLCTIREAIIGEVPEILVQGVQDGAVKKSIDIYKTDTKNQNAVNKPKRVYHYSDCPTNNAPAEKPGPCDCEVWFIFRKIKYGDYYDVVRDSTGLLDRVVTSRKLWSLAEKYGAHRMVIR